MMKDSINIRSSYCFHSSVKPKACQLRLLTMLKTTLFISIQIPYGLYCTFNYCCLKFKLGIFAQQDCTSWLCALDRQTQDRVFWRKITAKHFSTTNHQPLHSAELFLPTQLYQKSQHTWCGRKQHALHNSSQMEILFFFTNACQGERGGFLQSSSSQHLQPAKRPTLPSKTKTQIREN